MDNSGAGAGSLRPVISAEQIQKRVREMARQISDHYCGQSLHILAMLDNGFMFVADLVRWLEVPVRCTFIKPEYRTRRDRPEAPTLEIFFGSQIDIRDQHVLLVEGLLHSGVTSEFLMCDLNARGAASVRLAALLDRPSARRVPLQPDYFGFLVDDSFIAGYGLGSPDQMNRSLPYLAISAPRLAGNLSH